MKTIVFAATAAVVLVSSAIAQEGRMEYDGVLFPSRQVVLSTLATGVAVSIPYREGQTIARGKVLFAQDMRKDSLNLALARRKMERSEIEKTNEVENEIAVSLQEIACREKTIVAPFTGTIIRLMAKENEYYPAGSKVIEFADLSSLTTEIHVPDGDLQKILSRKAVILVRKGADSVNASYHAHNPLAEPGVELYLVKVVLPNKFRWAAGNQVKITVK